MDFDLNDEQRMIRDLARDFAAGEIAPIAAEIDETGAFPYATVKKMGEIGLLGLTASQAYGGVGADMVCYVLAMQEISRVCASHGVIMSVQNSLVNYGLEKFGTDDQRQRILTPLASGQAIGAYSLTEPQSGSDAANMRTTAVRDGADYVINGRKSWVTSGPVADYVVVFVTTNPKGDHRDTMAIVVESDRPGFARGKTEPKLGIRASATCELVFEDCRVPAANRLGDEGTGFKFAMTILDKGRIGIASQALGIAQAAYEASVAYAKERHAFGKAIAEHQAIQFMLADMATRIHAARLLTLRAALKADRGERFTAEASMAKLYASETANFVTDKAVQVHGGMGYSKELPVERYYRDARITEIYEGTSEIQRLVIARHVLGSAA
ncbi:acyl-CoA dehydrogenase [bacterium]|nr:acyl-CoA dehydrogenase [Chloroflexi bacterium CFX6]RIL10356.1 MAG: acyl-CoA dehydrogenase [bacterium]